MQIETDDFINIFLLRIVAVYTVIFNARRQAVPMRMQLLLIEVDPGLFLRSLRGLLARRRLRDGQGKSAPACDIYDGERGNLQSTLGTARTAVEEVPETERLLATLGDERRIMRRDQFRVRVERRHQHALIKVGPVKRLPKLPRDGAFSIVAVATQVAEVDATAQHEDRNEQRGKKLPLWLTEPGYLLQDVVNNCHKPLTGSSGSGIRSPHLTSSRLRLFSPFAQKMSEVLTKKTRDLELTIIDEVFQALRTDHRREPLLPSTFLTVVFITEAKMRRFYEGPERRLFRMLKGEGGQHHDVYLAPTAVFLSERTLEDDQRLRSALYQGLGYLFSQQFYEAMEG